MHFTMTCWRPNLASLEEPVLDVEIHEFHFVSHDAAAMCSRGHTWTVMMTRRSWRLGVWKGRVDVMWGLCIEAVFVNCEHKTHHAPATFESNC